ncbi:Myb-like DNA-binding domain protein, partial [Spraguea lophii 42_110]
YTTLFRSISYIDFNPFFMKKWSAQDIEILKAGIMKYGMNKWSKISSLLNKPENECKEQFYKTITYKDSNLRDNMKDSNNRKDVKGLKDMNNIQDNNNINDIKDNANINISLEERVIIEEMKSKNINNNVIAQYIGKNKIIIEEYLNHIKYDDNNINKNTNNNDTNNIDDNNNIDNNIDNNTFNYMDMI